MKNVLNENSDTKFTKQCLFSLFIVSEGKMNKNDFSLNSRRNWEGGRELKNSRGKLQRVFNECKRNVLVEITEIICKTQR